MSALFELGILRDQLFAKHFKPSKRNGEERDTDLVTEFLVQVTINCLAITRKLAIDQRNQAGAVQETSLEDFRACVRLAAEKLDPVNLVSFIEKIGIAIKRDAVKPLYDQTNSIILVFWNGARIDRTDLLPQLEALRTCPPLSRWSAPAGRQFVNYWLPRSDRLSYTTYRQRVRRLKLKSERPILVTKFVWHRKTDEVPPPVRFNVVFSPAGQEWIATQGSQKMSHDKMTPKLFNAANESGKGPLPRSP